ncbi:hypothetical protein Droror1_Dr00023484 [Drosera rotundifolia]
MVSLSRQNYKSMKDLLGTSRSSSPVRERASLGFSAVKSLMRREKDFLAPESGEDEVLLFIQSPLDAEGLTPSRKIYSTMHRDIHASPPESFYCSVL